MYYSGRPVSARLQLIGSSVDLLGILREPFALLPLGFLIVIIGTVMAVTRLVRRKRHSAQSRIR
ncbi:DUF3955 domain-containing protein [Microbulbifer okhotskensis]|uniref:DUF3955 domain-containing protein n=1 Tax=Microbulbifer okhotskensis TaxID=2926617 RepID=UPI00359C925D